MMANQVDGQESEHWLLCSAQAAHHEVPRGSLGPGSGLSPLNPVGVSAGSKRAGGTGR